MVVGEPTLMGGEFGDEDERLITRLENNQYEPNTADDDGINKDQKPPPGTNPGGPGGGGSAQQANSQFVNSPVQQSPWAQQEKKPSLSGTSTPGVDTEQKSLAD